MALGETPSTATDALEQLLLASRAVVDAGVDAARRGDYRPWRVPKGNGRWRQLHAPSPPLKRLQSLVLRRLLSRASVSPFAHGFVRGRSIVTNAKAHADTAFGLVGLDLEDAYPSVSPARVRAALEWGLGRYLKDFFPGTPYSLVAETLDLITVVCTHEDALPQGAPTSGMLLNLACARLDRLAAKLVRRDKAHLPDLRYSRYADDLTFTASVEIPADFVEEAATRVLRAGFRPNRRKVRRTTADNRALVICGVRIHEGRLGLPRRVLRRYRALLHQALAFSPTDLPDEVRDHLVGALGFLTMVAPTCPAMLEEPLRRVVERHGSWLRPASRPARYVAPPYR
jgi:RNA-directed DNA polymerase